MRKKILYTISVLLLLSVIAKAQNEVDALKFSQFTPTGTARSIAMGGAFGALGADLSVIATNPAGTGLFRKSEIGVTTSWGEHQNLSTFNSVTNNSTNTSFQLSNIGFIVNTPLNNSGWKAVNAGFSYNNFNNFNSSVSVKGMCDNSSMLDAQTDLLNSGAMYPEDNPYYMSDAVYYDSITGVYTNDYNATGLYGTDLSHQVITSGYGGEYDFNVSGNYNDRFYVGATISYKHIKYSQTTFHSETPTNIIPLVDFTSSDYFDAIGNGFDLKLGLLVRLTQMIRLGASFHTPTIYNFNYNYYTDVVSNIEYSDGIYTNTAKSPYGEYDWKLTSPARYTLSGAVVISRIAIVSADFEYVDYSSMNMSADDYLFEDENNRIDNIYKGTTNLRAGAEFRFWAFSVRAGAGYYGSPYKSTEPNSNNYRLTASGGIGINTQSVYFNVAYQYSTKDEYYYMWGYEESKVSIENTNNTFIATLGFRF